MPAGHWVWISEGKGDPGAPGLPGDPGNSGPTAHGGNKKNPIITSLDFQGLADPEWIEELVQAAENDFAIEQLKQAAATLQFAKQLADAALKALP